MRRISRDKSTVSDQDDFGTIFETTCALTRAVVPFVRAAFGHEGGSYRRTLLRSDHGFADTAEGHCGCDGYVLSALSVGVIPADDGGLHQ